MLNTEQSARRMRLARVLRRATEVFDSTETAIYWIQTPNAAFASRAPIGLMDTDAEYQSVLDTLSRIEEGALS